MSRPPQPIPISRLSLYLEPLLIINEFFYLSFNILDVTYDNSFTFFHFHIIILHNNQS